MDYASRGEAALAASDANTALVEYTRALIEHPLSPDYFVQRSTAFARLKPKARLDLALKDAELAVLCGRKRGKRDKIQIGQQRRVVSLYLLGRFADAKFILDTMQKWRPKDNRKEQMEHAMWTAKIDGKLKTSTEPEQTTVTAKEYPNGADLPDEKVMVEILKAQLNEYDTSNIEAVGDVNAPTFSSSSADSATANPSLAEQTTGTTLAAPKAIIRHEWYQNNQNVTITIYAKNVDKKATEIEINADSVGVSFPHPGDSSSTFEIHFDPLFALVDPERSKGRVLSTKVELTLAKAVEGRKWPAVEGTEPLTKVRSSSSSNNNNNANSDMLNTVDTLIAARGNSPRSSFSASNPSASKPVVDATTASTKTDAGETKPKETGPAYPTSSKSGPKNWDKLAKDLTAKKAKPQPKDPKPSSSPNDPSKQKKGEEAGSDDDNKEAQGEADYDSDFEGGDAVDGFFKKLYAGADPDTRRAMMKSFTESNGTSLSTNWDDVGKKFIEPVKSKDEE